jgi:hypothetical protein
MDRKLRYSLQTELQLRLKKISSQNFACLNLLKLTLFLVVKKIWNIELGFFKDNINLS